MKESALLLDMYSETLQNNREAIYLFVRRLMNLGRPFLLQSDIRDEFSQFCASPEGAPMTESGFGKLLQHAQESIIVTPWLYLAVRPSIARWSYLRIHAEALQVEDVGVARFQRA